MPSSLSAASAWLTQSTSGEPFSKSIPNCSSWPGTAWSCPTIVPFGISTAVMYNAVGRSARIASTWSLRRACLAALVSSKTTGSESGLITSRMAVSDVVPVWAPSRMSWSCAALVTPSASGPLSMITAWAAV